ncbi:flagellar assembly protein FliW [Conexibacter sp. CPCC 206217]|uniref:flagellar assembly protein FliW n=1 Tax=Conexibacter sp. CPCC 206217 TaxID=3064574 RepID=UPI0027278C65|nr:flagellar assembly protein FliW [Conexibacter sp. CPCC 206217]MDO8211434.1 flagellar assembly protein FliW [Conexibacter sp. CPCC 206217]
MSLTIDSTRFGQIEVDPDSVVEFPHGMIGFESRRFALVARDADADFLWLHSVDDPALALPVTDPRRFFGGFEVELAEEERERLGLPQLTATDIYVTVRASDQLEGFTANLRAPIVISEGRGHQVINQAAEARLRAPLFEQLAEAADDASGQAA